MLPYRRENVDSNMKGGGSREDGETTACDWSNRNSRSHGPRPRPGRSCTREDEFLLRTESGGSGGAIPGVRLPLSAARLLSLSPGPLLSGLSSMRAGLDPRVL